MSNGIWTPGQQVATNWQVALNDTGSDVGLVLSDGRWAVQFPNMPLEVLGRLMGTIIETIGKVEAKRAEVQQAVNGVIQN